MHEKITIYDEIIVELSWDQCEPITVESDFNNAFFNNYYKNIFPNWQEFIENTQYTEPKNEQSNGFREDGCDYLIITHPDFASEITEFANWKNAKGFMTKVVDTTIAGSTSNEIEQYIQDAYDTWHSALYLKEIVSYKRLLAAYDISFEHLPRKEKNLLLYLIIACQPRFKTILELGCSFSHSPHCVSFEGIMGSHLLKYFPWIPMRPFL